MSNEISSAPESNPLAQRVTTLEPTNSSDYEEVGISTPDRIAYQTAAISMTLVALYVVFALLKYNWMKSECTRRRNDKSNNEVGSKTTVQRSESSTSNSSGSGKTKSTSVKNAYAMRIMSLAAASFTLIRIACQQLELAPANGYRVDCRDYQVSLCCLWILTANSPQV